MDLLWFKKRTKKHPRGPSCSRVDNFIRQIKCIVWSIFYLLDRNLSLNRVIPSLNNWDLVDTTAILQGIKTIDAHTNQFIHLQTKI